MWFLFHKIMLNAAKMNILIIISTRFPLLLLFLEVSIQNRSKNLAIVAVLPNNRISENWNEFINEINNKDWDFARNLSVKRPEIGRNINRPTFPIVPIIANSKFSEQLKYWSFYEFGVFYTQTVFNYFRLNIS